MTEAIAAGAGIIDALKQGTRLGGDLGDLISQIRDWDEDDYAEVERVGRQNGHAPRDNQKQNEQVSSIAKKLGLTQDEQRKLHDEITGQGYSFQEILEIAESMFGK